jgi:hypothetical protein
VRDREEEEVERQVKGNVRKLIGKEGTNMFNKTHIYAE